MMTSSCYNRHSQSYIGLGTPFDADHIDFLEFKTCDQSKRLGEFLPSNFSQVGDRRWTTGYWLWDAGHLMISWISALSMAAFPTSC